MLVEIKIEKKNNDFEKFNLYTKIVNAFNMKIIWSRDKSIVEYE